MQCPRAQPPAVAARDLAEARRAERGVGEDRELVESIHSIVQRLFAVGPHLHGLAARHREDSEERRQILTLAAELVTVIQDLGTTVFTVHLASSR